MSAARKIQPVTRCGFVIGLREHPEHFSNHAGFSSYSRPTAKKLADLFLSLLEEARSRDVAAHEANVSAMANNKAIADEIEAYMTAIDMPRSWHEMVRNSRSRYPKSATHEAGYLADIRRNVITDDYFADATRAYEKRKATHADFAVKAEREAAEAVVAKERQAEADKAARRADLELAAIILRYSLDFDLTWDSALDALTSKDARLNLAVAMQQCREDWSDGPKPVFRALYDPQTDEDRAIVKCVRDVCEDWDGDGRCFRDCEWSYDAIFASIADRQLVTDARLAMQRVTR